MIKGNTSFRAASAAPCRTLSSRAARVSLLHRPHLLEAFIDSFSTPPQTAKSTSGIATRALSSTSSPATALDPSTPSLGTASTLVCLRVRRMIGQSGFGESRRLGESDSARRWRCERRYEARRGWTKGYSILFCCDNCTVRAFLSLHAKRWESCLANRKSALSFRFKFGSPASLLPSEVTRPHHRSASNSLYNLLVYRRQLKLKQVK